MKTKEIINGKEIEINWQFAEVMERHDSNWCEWRMEGEDSEGNRYSASAQADGSEPEDTYDSIQDIEQL